MDTCTALHVCYAVRRDAPQMRPIDVYNADKPFAKAAQMKLPPFGRAGRMLRAGLRGPIPAALLGLGAVGAALQARAVSRGKQPPVMASRLATHRHRQRRQQEAAGTRPGQAKWTGAQAARTERRAERVAGRAQALREREARQLGGSGDTADYSPNQPRDQTGKFGGGGGGGQGRAPRAMRKLALAKVKANRPGGLNPGQRGALIGGAAGLLTGPGAGAGALIGAGIGSAAARPEERAKWQAFRAAKRKARAGLG